MKKSRAKNDQDADKTSREGLRSKSKALAVMICVAVAVVIAIVTVIILKDVVFDSGHGDDIEVANDGEELVTMGDNTELSSGSITTTIDGKSITYAAAYVVDGIDADISSGTYESLNDYEVTFLVINGGSLKISGDVTINKSGSVDFAGRGDNYSFYGINSAVVVVGEGSSATIDGATIGTSVSGANAVVATNGGTVKIKKSLIKTYSDNSRGLHATYAGEITADDVEINTKGGSCASLATDRGGGTVTASNMRLSTAGAGSPLVYSTGNVTVSNSTGTATGSQIAVVEGNNSITLNDCDFSANGVGNRNNVDNAGVMIYQSMSGDADGGTGSFVAKNCKLTVSSSSDIYDKVPFFFVTNTNAGITLENAVVSFSESEYFVSALGTEEWGKTGLNGGNVVFSLSNVSATNMDVEVDAISSVTGM